MTSVALSLKPFVDRIAETDLEKLCRANPDARLEIDSDGKLIIMSPTGSESGKRNTSLIFQVELWNRQQNLGIVFDSSTGFKLSNGAIRSPDVSWVTLAKWDNLTKQQQRKFAPLDPDLVIELMSPTDDRDELRCKMREYMDCGTQLGWLIDPDVKQVEIYRSSGQKSEILDNPQTLSGENVLPNLIISLKDIFES